MIDLEEIKAREKAASPGPWDMESQSGNIYDATNYCVVDANYGHYAGHKRNLEFIAHAREDIPSLIARVEELVSVVRSLHNPRGCFACSNGLKCRAQEAAK